MFTYRRQHSTRVRVETSLGLLLVGPQQARIVVVGVFNDSAHPVRVTSVGLFTQDRTGRTMPFMHRMEGATLPGTIPPRDSGQGFALLQSLKENGLNEYEPVVAFAYLSDGTRIKSNPVRYLPPG
jgi:hypothetical protein